MTEARDHELFRRTYARFCGFRRTWDSILNHSRHFKIASHLPFTVDGCCRWWFSPCCNTTIRPDKKSPCALCISSHPQLTATAMLDALGMSDAMRYLPTLTIFLSSLLHIQRWEKFRAKVNARQWVVMHLMFASLVYALPPHSAVASFGRALTLFHCTVAYAVSRSAHFSHPWRSSRTQLCQR
jgi:hypothetical protein